MVLLSAHQMSAIRKVGEKGMADLINTYRSSAVDTEDPAPASNDFGDDARTDPFASEHADVPVDATPHLSNVKAWFLSKLQTNDVVADGQIATIDIHVIRVPVGTDIVIDDIIRKVGSTEEYTVVDTNADDTWAEMMKVNVRRRE